VKRRSRSRWPMVMLSCIVAVPAVAALMGMYGAEASMEELQASLAVGLLLGGAHVLLRPVLRVLFAPLGCLTFGLFGMVIDVALLYACDRLVAGFAIPGFWYALITAIVINALCAASTGKH